MLLSLTRPLLDLAGFKSPMLDISPGPLRSSSRKFLLDLYREAGGEPVAALRLMCGWENLYFTEIGESGYRLQWPRRVKGGAVLLFGDRSALLARSVDPVNLEFLPIVFSTPASLEEDDGGAVITIYPNELFSRSEAPVEQLHESPIERRLLSVLDAQAEAWLAHYADLQLDPESNWPVILCRPADPSRDVPLKEVRKELEAWMERFCVWMLARDAEAATSCITLRPIMLRQTSIEFKPILRVMLRDASDHPCASEARFQEIFEHETRRRFPEEWAALSRPVPYTLAAQSDDDAQRTTLTSLMAVNTLTSGVKASASVPTHEKMSARAKLDHLLA